MKSSFESLIQYYEMGEAYKRITEEMGPSPQLVAFINYETMKNNDIALESFNLELEHQMILSDIENSNFKELALESLGNRIKKAIQKAKDYLTKHPKNKDFLKYKNAKLTSKDFGQRLFYYDDAKAVIDVFNKNVEQMEWISTRIPHSKKIEDWISFFDSRIKDQENNEYDKRWRQYLYPFAERKRSQILLHSTPDLKDSGWTEENFKQIIGEYEKLADIENKTITKIIPFYNNCWDIFEEFQDSDHKEATKAYKAVQTIVTFLYDGVDALYIPLNDLENFLNKVASHFRIVK